MASHTGEIVCQAIGGHAAKVEGGRSRLVPVPYLLDTAPHSIDAPYSPFNRRKEKPAFNLRKGTTCGKRKEEKRDRPVRRLQPDIDS